MWYVWWERREAACGAVRRGVGGLRGSLRGVRCLTPPLRSGRAVIITPQNKRHVIRRVDVCIERCCLCGRVKMSFRNVACECSFPFRL